MIKCCFFGLGSIGIRHLNNLIEITDKTSLKISIDAFRSSGSKLNEQFKKIINQEISNIHELDFYDFIFITNPTSLHYQTLLNTLNQTKHIFIEKPVFESINYDLNLLNLKKDTITHVACPLRFNPVINYLKSYIKNKKVYSVRAICSSYLPEWRPDRDYRKIYSANKSMGGGVSLDLIHEIDYLTYLFGFPVNIINFKRKFSNLEIDSDDISLYIIEYKDKVAELHLDYFGRIPERKIELYMEDEVIIGDIINNKLVFLKEKKEISFNPENIFYKEMEYFLNLVINNEKSFNDINLAYKVLGLSEGKIL
jgi:predicted dehydrogenase